MKIDISVKDVKIKKEPEINQDPKPCRKKRIETARSNFELKDSLYSDIKETRNRRNLKGNTIDVYAKYYKSNLSLKDQAPIASNTSRSEKRPLPSYRGNDFKGIIEYNDAGKYRSETVTEKCNNVSTKMRSMSYAELHEYDFRKRPEKF